VYARVNILEGPPERMDDALRYFQENVLPNLQQMDGFKGTIALGDRQSGKTLGITFWESEEDIRSTEAGADRSRSRLAEATGETVAGVEIYEVGLFEVES
jgi:heme-degrading monooxygenase HmoA